MSLGIRGFLDDFLDVTKIIRAKNILPVFAVGNEGLALAVRPETTPKVFLSELSTQAKIASFSSSQKFVRTGRSDSAGYCCTWRECDLSKTWWGFFRPWMERRWRTHIAGLAALLMEAKPNATASEVESALFASSTLGSISSVRGNRGFPDAVRAFTVLTGITLNGASTREFQGWSQNVVSRVRRNRRAQRRLRKSIQRKISWRLTQPDRFRDLLGFFVDFFRGDFDGRFCRFDCRTTPPSFNRERSSRFLVVDSR
jgi:hypothetical protein